MSGFSLRFPSATASSSSTGHYRLLELPPELVKVVEAKDVQALADVTIRGRTNDDAVLCTRDATYAMRSVQLSNSFLVLTAARDSDVDADTTMDVDEGNNTAAINLVIRDFVTEIIELVPAVPKLDKLTGLLRENVYDREADANDEGEDDDEERPNKRRRFTYGQVRGLVQASDVELERGLREQRILEIDGYLQPLPPTQLTQILSVILNLIPTHSWKPKAVPLKKLIEELQFEHDVQENVTKQICRWFGHLSPEGDEWSLDEEAVVREVGLGLLGKHRDEARTEDEILEEWKDQVGDTFASTVKMDLLSGNLIDTTDPSHAARTAKPIQPTYKYFPASQLPANPTQRFTDLFLTKKSWRMAELTPFLQDIAVDKKARDKLLMKFTRTSTDAQGTMWYSARAKY